MSLYFEHDDQIILVCTPCDLATVTAQLHMASWLPVGALLPDRLLSVTAQLGQPSPVGLHSSWIDATLRTQVLQWLRPQLIGSVLVDDRLYRATPERTMDLVAYDGVIGWLLEQVASQKKGDDSHDYSRGSIAT